MTAYRIAGSAMALAAGSLITVNAVAAVSLFVAAVAIMFAGDGK